MPKFECHLFVCCNRREPGHPRGSCGAAGEAVREAFKSELKRRGLTGLIRANEAGCLDQCECGPTLVVYPSQTWYGNVRPDDVPRIIDETLLAGRALPDLQISDAALNTKGKIAWRRDDSAAPGEIA